ncbi:MAG: acetate--CoA ligase family protein [Planctomycetota bacterium]|nr:acetate--CoA ligase family protein [Planctomycetota bacterium]
MSTTSSHATQSDTSKKHVLDGVFSPQSVAVLGVTPTPGTVPFDIFHNILSSGYRGTVYPVAPGKRSICAVKAYRYVLDIEDDVDQAVIVYPSNVVERALEQCGQKGIKSVIVISAGFREVGPEGIKREQRIKDICKEYGIAMVGPNCLGVINTDPKVQLNASFARKMPAAGRIAFLSQSGALCTAVLDYARKKTIGFSKFVSFGNKAGVTEIELFDYLHKDPDTDIILLYLEELRNGRGLMEAARRVTRGENAKPILAIKSGRTPQGADAASSHTGSLAGEDAICDAVFREAGIIRVNSIEQMFNSAVMYTYQPMPSDDRLAIVTNAGGPGVMATDAAVGFGLSIPRFDQSTTEKLKQALPDTANVKNPVDVIGDARSDRYDAAIEAVLADPNVDQALVILTPQSMTDIESIAEGVCRVHEKATKPISCSFMGAADVQPGIRLLQKSNIPHYVLPEWACEAMADIQKIRHWREQTIEEPKRLPVDKAAAEAVINNAQAGYLNEDEALAVMKAYGLPVPEHRLAASVDEALAAAEAIGYPAVLRIVSHQIIHKSEVKGVALDLPDADAVRDAYETMLKNVAKMAPDATIDGILVRGMIPTGHEIILGAKRDPVFGPTIMFGLGGIYVELFKDVTFALAPMDGGTANRMIHQVKACDLLEGARGGACADIDNIRDCLVRVGQLMSDFDRIGELDVNPLIAGPAKIGNMVADVRIRITE